MPFERESTLDSHIPAKAPSSPPPNKSTGRADSQPCSNVDLMGIGEKEAKEKDRLLEKVGNLECVHNH